VVDFDGFPKETFAFLRALSKNNKKAWFDAHKDDYQSFYVEPANAFIAAMVPRVRKLSIGGGGAMRIYRDTRFSKDKKPYKDHLDLFFWHGKKKSWDVPGFFMRLSAGEVWLGAGMHHFVDPKRLASFRKAIDDDKRGKKIAAIVKKLEKAGYDVGGRELKTVPRGFDPEHERADLLKHKGLFAMVEAKPKDAQGSKFVGFCIRHFEALEPLNSWLV
jgi:uncharacterized protein (TIGR02453 family)